MNYTNVKEAEFLSRPNRFIAEVCLDGEIKVCHVKNTGRCRELLVPGARVWVSESDNPLRKTRYDLICVEKEGHLINMDSQAPNDAAEEWLNKKQLFPGLTYLKREVTYQDSRFDFYLEEGEKKIFLEVKGVTLEKDGVVLFPDAPTIRGARHIRELAKCVEEGYEAWLLLVVQMKGVTKFLPNEETDPEFAKALREASQKGVHILAMDCVVTPDSMTIDQKVPVQLQTEEDGWTVLPKITKPLLAWFDKSARVLPWREHPTPYRVWVSEIMLQQTRVEAVKPYYERFLTALPDVAALAACPEDRLLKLWEGLGYYNRVRNLQKAAQVMMEEYAGELPADYEKLLKLPGIGSYTAGAVASIACQIPVPAVDGNVLRVIARVCCMEEDVLKQSVKRQVEEKIQGVIPGDRPGAYNQALMELGAMVCVPNGPAKCNECPLQELCMARREGKISELPKKASKKPRKIEERTVLVIRDGERAAIRKRPSKGLLAGLYELPNLSGSLDADQVLETLKTWGMNALRIQKLGSAKHIFSHVEWHMTGYAIRVEELEHTENAGFLFVEPEKTEKEYPIPAAFAAYTEDLNIRLGVKKDGLENE